MVQVASVRVAGGRAQPALIAAIGILYWTAHTMIRPLVGPEVIALGGTAGDAGIALASFAVVPTVLAIPIGGVTDRLGAKRMLLAGGGLMVAGGVVLLTPSGIGGVIASQAIAGVGTLMMWVSLQAAITAPSAGETIDGRNSRIASFSLYLAAGQAIGPLLGGLLAEAFGRTTSFAVFTGISVVLVGLSALTRRQDPASAGILRPPVWRVVAGSYPQAARLLRRPVVLVTVLVSFMALVAFDLRNAFLPLLLGPAGFDALQIGLVLTAAAVAGFASRPLFAVIMRNVPPAAMILAVLSVSALTGAGVAFVADSMPLVMLLMTLNGFALGFAQPLTLSLMADFTAPGERGLASGLRSMANRAAQFANPVVLGLVSTTFGLAAGFVAVGAMVLVATALSVAVLARRGPDRFGSMPGGE